MDFVLVHGAYHGAWCWNLLVPELDRRGHQAVAVDLPTEDPNAGAAEYADAVVEAAAGLRDPIVVGHSMGGLTIPLVAHRRPVGKLVFLCAMVPRAGLSMNDIRGMEAVEDYRPESNEFTDHGNDVWSIGPNTAIELFYHDVPVELAAEATEHLRPQAWKVMREVSPLEEWPSVESASIVCRDDRALSPDWERTIARSRLGVEPIEMDGGHSPFLTRPGELAAVLEESAKGVAA